MTVYVGSNNQAYSVMIDTTSSDIWIPSWTCRTGGCAGSPVLATTTIGTSTDETWSIPYENGIVSGFSAIDYWSVFGMSSQVAFGLATQVDIGFNNDVCTCWYALTSPGI
jgi:Eukaryotic aspartyl protease